MKRPRVMDDAYGCYMSAAERTPEENLLAAIAAAGDNEIEIEFTDGSQDAEKLPRTLEDASRPVLIDYDMFDEVAAPASFLEVIAADMDVEEMAAQHPDHQNFPGNRAEAITVVPVSGEPFIAVEVTRPDGVKVVWENDKIVPEAEIADTKPFGIGSIVEQQEVASLNAAFESPAYESPSLGHDSH